MAADADHEPVEIVRQTIEYDREAALRRAVGNPLSKIKHLLTSPELESHQLLYKPYYEFTITLRKEVLRGDPIVDTAVMVVDGITGITRGYAAEDIDTETASVDPSKLLKLEIDEDEAVYQAKRKRSHIAFREKRDVEFDSLEPRIVYKPVWKFVFSGDDTRMIDGNTGETYGTGLLE